MSTAAPATPRAAVRPLTGSSRRAAAEAVQFAQPGRRLDDLREADLLARQRQGYHPGQQAHAGRATRDRRQPQSEQGTQCVGPAVAEHDALAEVLGQRREGGAEWAGNHASGWAAEG